MVKEHIEPDRKRKASVESNEANQYLIVEIGSGDNPYWVETSEGYREKFRSDPNIQYIGIDDDESQLHLGKNLLQRENEKYDLEKTGRVHYVKAEGQKLPFADNSVSEIILRNIIGDEDDINDRKKAEMIDEVARTLKVEGILKIIE
ncbi:MAG: methyltransferase domain-containing protein [bacterium]|nr:methyltransferase domain-containing protein [bacterium]